MSTPGALGLCPIVTAEHYGDLWWQASPQTAQRELLDKVRELLISPPESIASSAMASSHDWALTFCYHLEIY